MHGNLFQWALHCSLLQPPAVLSFKGLSAGQQSWQRVCPPLSAVPLQMGVDATINQQPVVVATQQVQSISTDNSMLGVVAAIAVVALSAALVLPLSVVSVLVAALAGVWWLSTGSSCTSVQMSPLPGRASGSSAAAALNSSTSAGQQVVTAAAGGQQQVGCLGAEHHAFLYMHAAQPSIMLYRLLSNRLLER